jgi:hypothetical protein
MGLNSVLGTISHFIFPVIAMCKFKTDDLKENILNLPHIHTSLKSPSCVAVTVGLGGQDPETIERVHR